MEWIIIAILILVFIFTFIPDLNEPMSPGSRGQDPGALPSDDMIEELAPSSSLVEQHNDSPDKA